MTLLYLFGWQSSLAQARATFDFQPPTILFVRTEQFFLNCYHLILHNFILNCTIQEKIAEMTKILQLNLIHTP